MYLNGSVIQLSNFRVATKCVTTLIQLCQASSLVMLRIHIANFALKSDSSPTKEWQLSSLESYHLSQNTWKLSILYIMLLYKMLSVFSAYYFTICHPTCCSANSKIFPHDLTAESQWKIQCQAGLVIIWAAKNCMQHSASHYGCICFGNPQRKQT